MGDLALDLSLSGQTLSGSGCGSGSAVALVGHPSQSCSSAVFDRTETAPSFDQLDGPLVTTINRIFDFARQETVDVVLTTGGNPDLAPAAVKAFP